MRPSLLLTEKPIDSLRSLKDVQSAVGRGHARTLWHRMIDAADHWRTLPPYVPTDMTPGRDPLMAKHANPDYVIVQASADRMMVGALAALITGDLRYRDDVLQQMDTLFDTDHWPEWRDMAHRHIAAADLRTGQLSQAVGLAYDWLHPLLTDSERHFIVDGLDRCGIRRYLQAADENASYFTRASNWQTCIVGGLGIAGMALREDHPASGRLMDLAHERILAYRSVYGPEGEFNENVGYAGATRLPVTYFSIHRYYTQGAENILAEHPFPAACIWYMYMTAPPGHMAPFGDMHLDAPPAADYFSAVAAATRDELFQWYYLTYEKQSVSQINPYEVLWFDETVATRPPDDRLPTGRVFPAHSGCISSRTDWQPDKTPSVVFSKAGHGSELHGNHDAGQVCIEGYGERLIVDPGSPPMYPADFFDENRYRYYNAGVVGHNVLMFGGREMADGEDRRAEIPSALFDDQGGTWTIDVTACYDNVKQVMRQVVHHKAGLVAVLDTAMLEAPEEISLRWHTVDKAVPDDEGGFIVASNGVGLSARVVCLEGDGFATGRREHAYQPPFNKGRLGDVFEDRHESYVEAIVTDTSCRLLSLFAIYPPGEKPGRWTPDQTGWKIVLNRKSYTVQINSDKLHILEG